MEVVPVASGGLTLDRHGNQWRLVVNSMKSNKMHKKRNADDRKEKQTRRESEMEKKMDKSGVDFQSKNFGSGESKSSLVPENVATGITSESKSKWLLAHKQPQLVKLTFSDCICFSNLSGDGDYRLIIADLGDRFAGTTLASNRKGPTSMSPRLLILRGTSVQSELCLPETPVGVISFRLQGTAETGGEVLAVAAGSCVYVYKNLKPFYKFALPPAPTDSRERDLWQQCSTDQIKPSALCDQLLHLQNSIGRCRLSYVSQILLDLQSAEQQERYVRQTLNKVTNDPNTLAALLTKANVITCIGRMRKTGGDLQSDVCLLLGTEHCQLLVVEPNAFTVLQCVPLAAVPVFVRSSGAFEVDFRILILCRDSQVYVLRRGWSSPRLVIQLTAQPIALVRQSSNVLVGCMNQVLTAHTLKAACLWSIRVPAPICAMISIHIQTLGVRLVAVALRSCDLLFFNERHLVDQIRTDSAVISMHFGHFGREEHTLVLITESGDVLIYILKRTAKFFNMDPVTAGCGVTSGSFSSSSNTSTTLLSSTLPTAAPLHIPKKTKLFVDQTMHERENSLSIHRTFQEDLYFFRLTTARAFVKALSSSLNPISVSLDTPIKLSAQVHGLGPIFRLLIEVQNTSSERIAQQLLLVLAADVRIYRIHQTCIPIPFLVPGMCTTFGTRVEMISELNLTDMVKVHVMRSMDRQPVVSAIINMPASEPIV